MGQRAEVPACIEDIEVTPAMIEAGRLDLYTFNADCDDTAVVVAEIYRLMEWARLHEHERRS